MSKKLFVLVFFTSLSTLVGTLSSTLLTFPTLLTLPRAHAVPIHEKFRPIVQTHLPDVKLCYKTSLGKNPDSIGKVVVDWTVNDTGIVTVASIDKMKTTLKNADLQECILAKIKNWNFPPAKRGSVLTASYPFEFNKSN